MCVSKTVHNAKFLSTTSDFYTTESIICKRSRISNETIKDQSENFEKMPSVNKKSSKWLTLKKRV